MEKSKDVKKRGNYKPKRINEIKLNLFYSNFKKQNKEKENGK